MVFYISVILAVIAVDYFLLKIFFMSLSKLVALKIGKVIEQSLGELYAAGDLSKETETKIMQNFRTHLKTEHVTKEDILTIWKD